MKKIGIVSIFRTGNYGGTLQAYALLKSINENSYGNAEIINYTCDSINGKLSFKKIVKLGFFHTAAFLIDKICYLPRMKKINSFIDSYVTMPLLNKKELSRLNNNYDIFLSGSDQLWNPDIQDNDGYYLLDFVLDNEKKRSYASSFGKYELPDLYTDKYKRLLSAYKIITVREKSGADIVERLIGKRPLIVPDPVFLISREDWKLLIKKRIYEEKYIFAYRLTYSTKITKAVERAVKELNISSKSSPFLLGHCHNNEMLPALSSFEWLQLIHDSEYVITDSFHAVLFSIIFSKQFYYIVTTSTAKDRLSRVETILDELEIHGRIVDSEKDCDFSKNINYHDVAPKVIELRRYGLEILKKILEL